MYEIGLQQQLSDNIGVDITLFYRDVRDWVGTSPLITTYKVDVQYSKYVNKDYENVKGITVKVEKRLSDNYLFRTDYTFQSAEGTYSNPQDEFNDINANRAPVLQLLPTNWDQKHTFNAQFVYQISDWTFSIIGRYWSGQPYTPTFPVGETATETRGQLNNSARLPSQRGLDLTINKLFLFSGLRLELFLNVYNLLDLRDPTNVFTDTGSAEYTTTIDPSSTAYNSYNPNRISTVEDFVLRPANFTGPRQVQLGLILGF
jgi:outer membrane receptor for ferrienterochelin and colicin